VIRALNSPDPMTLSEVARASSLTRASARRFVLTLETGVRAAIRRPLRAHPRVLELGFAYLSALGLPEVAAPTWSGWSKRYGSPSVSVLDGESVVYVAGCDARIMNVVINVGTRFPAYATSMGRVLLAGLDSEECTELLDQIELVPLSHDTITTRPQLEAELELVRRAGYAIVDQELESACDRSLRRSAIATTG